MGRYTVLLVSTYELGRQPFGLAWPAAWLRDAGAEVLLADLSRAPLDEASARRADLVAFHLPMHTATRLATRVIPEVRGLNPRAHLAAFGLYAPLNEAHLRALGVGTIVSGEPEAALRELAATLSGGRVGIPAAGTPVPAAPDRRGLPALDGYARLQIPGAASRVTGHTEASRGCKYRCRHCPVVPVYQGRFRAVKRDVVLADIDQLVAAGARHITFGDPDFLNGPSHAAAIAGALHARHPEVTFDMTTRIEHLVTHARLVPSLVEAGLVLVTSAAESVDDRVLARLDKGHTRNHIVAALELADRAGFALNLTFIPFTPWTTIDGYRELLDFVAGRALVDAVQPVQLGLRLLIPARSPLLELEEIRAVAGEFDPGALVHPWIHPDPEMDRLQARAMECVRVGQARGDSRAAIFARLAELAGGAECMGGRRRRDRGSAASPGPSPLARAAIPFLTEPWYC